MNVTWPAFVKFARDVVFKKKMVFGIEMTEFRDAEMLRKRNRNGGSKLPSGLDPSYRSDTFIGRAIGAVTLTVERVPL